MSARSSTRRTGWSGAGNTGGVGRETLRSSTYARRRTQAVGWVVDSPTNRSDPPIDMRRSFATIALGTLLLVSPFASFRAQTRSWLVVPGWINPDSADRRQEPIAGGVFYETGYPITATVLSGAEMIGIDLALRGAFRYHDSRGVAHGRSLATSAGGLVLFGVATGLAKHFAPWAARHGNARRIAEAEARAREVREASHRPLAGLATGDTVLARGAARSNARGFTVSASISAEELYFRGGGEVASRT